MNPDAFEYVPWVEPDDEVHNWSEDVFAREITKHYPTTYEEVARSVSHVGCLNLECHMPLLRPYGPSMSIVACFSWMGGCYSGGCHISIGGDASVDGWPLHYIRSSSIVNQGWRHCLLRVLLVMQHCEGGGCEGAAGTGARASSLLVQGE